MGSSKLSSSSLKDQFVRQLQGMILSGDLLIGSKLPPERTLAEQMHVSRTVVNSGLAELAEQGFLEVHPRQGTCVADYRRQGNLDTLIAIMQCQGGALSREEIRSILEVRRVLEHLAVDRAILYASDGALDRLGVTLVRVAAAPGPSQAAEAAFHFHHELALAGGNSVVPQFYCSFKPPMTALWERFCGRYGIFSLVRNVETLYTLIRARDLDGASRWIDEYLEEVISGRQQIYD